MEHPLRTLLSDLVMLPPLRVAQVALDLLVGGAGLVSAYILRRSKQQTLLAAIMTK